MSEPALRYELKFLYPRPQLAQARLWMRLHPAGLKVAYPPRWVNSIYFDTRSLTCLNDNLDGTEIRNKLRLRWYGDSQSIISPHLELKHKHGLLGNKELLSLDCSLDLTQSWYANLVRLRGCLPPLWQSRFQAVSQPALLNRYRREYYVTADGSVRVTLDSDQVAYDQWNAARPNLRAALPIKDLIVIEVKAYQEFADRIQAVADAFPLPRTRNSKYASSMLTALYSR